MHVFSFLLSLHVCTVYTVTLQVPVCTLFGSISKYFSVQQLVLIVGQIHSFFSSPQFADTRVFVTSRQTETQEEVSHLAFSTQR